MSVESIVIATDLNKTFKTEQKDLDDVQALQGINMQIKTGKLTALVGPDGAGKTTFLRLIAGLYKPTTGSLKVLGMDVAKDPQSVQDRISYMPQKFGLYEDLSIQENLDLYADLHGVPMDVRKERFARLLKITDLARFTERPAGKLSGGMKQKLGLACTLVRSPELLLLDEPSVGVDPLSRRDLWIIIEQLVREENLSVILSTAYMDEAERCHEVYVMLDGQVLKQGTPDELTAQAQGQTWQVKPRPDMKARVLQAYLLDNQYYIALACARAVRKFMPATSNTPLLAGSKPQSIRNVVVLPAPLGPSKPKISPRDTSNEVLATAVKSPKVRTKSFTTITGFSSCCFTLCSVFTCGGSEFSIKDIEGSKAKFSCANTVF
jgi:ABC-2 type transport system ATP-binding protein